MAIDNKFGLSDIISTKIKTKFHSLPLYWDLLKSFYRKKQSKPEFICVCMIWVNWPFKPSSWIVSTGWECLFFSCIRLFAAWWNSCILPQAENSQKTVFYYYSAHRKLLQYELHCIAMTVQLDFCETKLAPISSTNQKVNIHRLSIKLAASTTVLTNVCIHVYSMFITQHTNPPCLLSCIIVVSIMACWVLADLIELDQCYSRCSSCLWISTVHQLFSKDVKA